MPIYDCVAKSYQKDYFCLIILVIRMSKTECIYHFRFFNVAHLLPFLWPAIFTACLVEHVDKQGVESIVQPCVKTIQSHLRSVVYLLFYKIYLSKLLSLEYTQTKAKIKWEDFLVNFYKFCMTENTDELWQ